MKPSFSPPGALPRLHLASEHWFDDEVFGRMLAGEHESTMIAQGHGEVHYGFLGIEVLDRLLAADPGFGTRGTPVTFVSIGSVIPWLGLDERAEAFRAALGPFAQARAIGWLDIRAEWDWLSIHLRDPLTACGIPSPGPGRPAP